MYIDAAPALARTDERKLRRARIAEDEPDAVLLERLQQELNDDHRYPTVTNHRGVETQSKYS